MPSTRRRLIASGTIPTDNLSVLEQVVNEGRARVGKDPLHETAEVDAPDAAADPHVETAEAQVVPAPAPTRRRQSRVDVSAGSEERKDTVRDLVEQGAEMVITLRIPVLVNQYIDEFVNRTNQQRSSRDGARRTKYRKQDAFRDALIDWVAANPLPDNPMDGRFEA